MTEPQRFSVVLPIPNRVLSPNARVHWRRKAKATKAYRKNAYLVALHLGEPRWTNARIELDFYFDTNRKRDKDNLLASMKAAMDGFADAGVIVNDSGFEYASPRLHVDKENPRVVVTILRIDYERKTR
jgi:crossover junction endodeoxyribonuclease RusA